MSNYIERWMTPWQEEVICAAEKALESKKKCQLPGYIVVHALTKEIGIALELPNIKCVIVRIQMGCAGEWIWGQVVWDSQHTYSTSLKHM